MARRTLEALVALLLPALEPSNSLEVAVAQLRTTTVQVVEAELEDQTAMVRMAQVRLLVTIMD